MRSEITFRERNIRDCGGDEEPEALLHEIISELEQAEEDLYHMLRLLEHGNPNGPGSGVTVLNFRSRQPATAVALSQRTRKYWSGRKATRPGSAGNENRKDKEGGDDQNGDVASPDRE